MSMFHNYPYTDFHDLNLDYIMKLARESLGIHLEVVGDKLQLKNDLGDVISNVTISYATKAEQDKDGKDIEAYIYDAGVNGRAIVFTRGNNDTEVIPFPEDAITDKNGKDITSYVANVAFSGENLVVTYGDNTSYSFKCPYAIKAQTDANGKDIETYMATVTVVGNALVFKDGAGVTLAEITVPYATTAGEAEVAEKARKDINGNAFVSDYGRNLIVDGNKIGIEAHDGTDLNKITVPFASLSTNATNAIQTVTVSGNNLLFTTYGGQQFTIQVPYSVKALNDDLGNPIKSTYVANVINNPITGEITFKDARGQDIVSITPVVDSAVHDSLGNDITDYVKSILTSPNSNFVTVTHGDNAVDTLTINYSTIAWKDTYGNAIGNTYCSLLTMGVDPQDGEPIVIGWNGETPKAEIFRLKVQAVSAQKDGLGNIITETYAVSLDYDSTDDKVSLINAEGNVISYINIDDATGSIIDNIVTDTDGNVESIDIDGVTYTFFTSDEVQTPTYSLVWYANQHMLALEEDGVEISSVAINLELEDISDVAGNASVGQILVYTAGATNMWRPTTPLLNTLDDVNLSGPTTGDILYMAGGTTHWTNKQLLLDDISNANVSSAQNGQVLTYDSSTQKWIPQTPSGGSGGSGALVVTLTPFIQPATQLDQITINRNFQVTMDKTYAEIAAADSVVFKYDDGTWDWKLLPTAIYTNAAESYPELNVNIFIVSKATGGIKSFKLDVSPWSAPSTIYRIT